MGSHLGFVHGVHCSIMTAYFSTSGARIGIMWGRYRSTHMHWEYLSFPLISVTCSMRTIPTFLLWIHNNIKTLTFFQCYVINDPNLSWQKHFCTAHQAWPQCFSILWLCTLMLYYPCLALCWFSGLSCLFNTFFPSVRDNIWNHYACVPHTQLETRTGQLPSAVKPDFSL